ncbi:MAG: hypothetical protein U5R31_15155 [Acidimicrobiia bacterium]|nr:hypothetical protein [Acidimicrobiia bacterium]
MSMPSSRSDWSRRLARTARADQVDLPDEVLATLEAEAARRGVSVEDLVAELVAEHVAAGDEHRFGFVGIMASGDGHLSENYKALRRDAFAGKAAKDA